MKPSRIWWWFFSFLKGWFDHPNGWAVYHFNLPTSTTCFLIFPLIILTICFGVAGTLLTNTFTSFVQKIILLQWNSIFEMAILCKNSPIRSTIDLCRQKYGLLSQCVFSRGAIWNWKKGIEIDKDKILRKLLIKVINPKFNFSIFPIMIHHFIWRNFTLHCVQCYVVHPVSGFPFKGRGRAAQQQFWEKWPQVLKVFYHFKSVIIAVPAGFELIQEQSVTSATTDVLLFTTSTTFFYQVYLSFLFQFVRSLSGCSSSSL